MLKAFLPIIVLLTTTLASADKPRPWQIYFQEAATPVMEKIVWLHDFLMIVVGIILAIVMVLMAYVCIKFNAKSNPIPNKFAHNVVLEVVWTVIPVIILIIIAVPSFKTLHYVEVTPPADITVKVVAHQWYWNYSYPDNGNFEFDSYLIRDKDLQKGQDRLLEVDNRVVIPAGKVVKFLLTSADVIHSFAVPSFGIKTDAVPGRINETWVKVDKPGVYYGQCSELCGVDHGFMPINVEVVPEQQFNEWVVSAQKKFGR